MKTINSTLPIFQKPSRTRLLYALALLFLLPIGIASAQTNIRPTSFGADYSTAYNEYGGFYNAPVYPNSNAFAALKSDGSITVWGGDASGGNPSEAPPGTGHTAIYSTRLAFAALKDNGSITVWGLNNTGGNPSEAPTGTGHTAVYSTESAFAALKNDGSITVWGDDASGGNPSEAPTGTGHTAVYSTESAFAALKNDGSITYGVILLMEETPAGTGHTAVYSTQSAFAALKNNGSIEVWGFNDGGNLADAPTGSSTGYISINGVEAPDNTLSTDHFNTNSINVFSTSSRTLKITGLENEKADVQLFDLLGKLILKTTVSLSPKTEVKLSKSIKTGIYIVKINTLKESFNKKIVLR